MQMHPMVTVKKAAALLGIDKSVLRQRLSEGSLKGERRMVGSKEKWFIYCGELDVLLDQRLPELVERAERTSIDGLSDFFTNGEVVPIGDEISTQSTESQPEPVEACQSEIEDRAAEVAGRFELENADTALQTNQNVEALPAIEAEFEQIETVDSGASDSPNNEAECQAESVHQSIDFSPNVPAKMLTESSFPQELFEVEGVLESQSAAEEVPGLEGIVRCLTIEFAYRLTEERQTICKLQDQLEEKDMLLRRIPLLEKSLHEVAACDRDKELELANLKAHVAILEKQVLRLKEPWWHRLNRWITGT